MNNVRLIDSPQNKQVPRNATSQNLLVNNDQ